MITYKYKENEIEDRKVSKLSKHEIDDSLINLGDSEILLNFSDTLKDIYPHLLPIQAYAYDSWDDIVEPLFYQMVYVTFAYKYGINLSYKNCHIYDSCLDNNKRINCNHIECVPKSFPLKARINMNWVTLQQEDLFNKSMVFISFGDGVHYLTGGLDEGDAKDVAFDLIRIEIIDKTTRLKISETDNDDMFIHKNDINYVFIAEEKR